MWEEKIGEKGEGFSGTCIKDTWTKPKGLGSRVGGTGEWSGQRGEWLGGNVDNCT